MVSNPLAPSVTTRDPKGRKFMSVVEAAYNKVRLSKEEAQRVNDTPGLAELVGNFIAENRLSNQFADEEVRSSYGYLSGYRNPVEISDQIDILRSHWPDLNPDPALRYVREAYPTLQLPSWVEGPFALIRPGFFSGRYGEELTEVLDALAKDYKGKFANYCVGKLGPEYLRQSTRTVVAMNRILERQPGSDILIVPEQFGMRHRGRSVRRARVVFEALEFGEGAKNNGTMLLTNPNRFQRRDSFWIDCAGDEFSSSADGEFSQAPYFLFFGDGEVGFSARLVDGFARGYGSSSGWSL